MFDERHERALNVLLRAEECARDVACDSWQFAISVAELVDVGLTTTDVRWLSMKHYVLLATEVTVPGDATRTFRPFPSTVTTVTTRLRVILTELGVEFSRALINPTHSPTVPDSYPHCSSHTPGTIRHPSWDSGRRELRVGATVVKRFRVPAPNQELVLQVFEEEGWPHSIDDPLPPVQNIDTQQRLRATIKSLNRKQCEPLIRFHANGGGQVICWDFQDSIERA